MRVSLDKAWWEYVAFVDFKLTWSQDRLFSAGYGLHFSGCRMGKIVCGNRGLVMVGINRKGCSRGIILSAVGLVACLGTASTVRATLIGINIAGERSTGEGFETLASTSSSGVVAQTNFNNVEQTATGTTSFSQSLNDSNGNATGLTVTSVTQADSYSAFGSAQTNTASQLLNGYLDGSTSVTPSITVTGLPSTGTYTVYVYANSDTAGRTGGLSVNGGSTIFFQTEGTSATSFVQATATTSGAAVSSDYAVFTTSGSTFTVTDTQTNGNTGIAGLQIATPEPASLGVLGFGGIGLLARRRRAAT